MPVLQTVLPNCFLIRFWAQLVIFWFGLECG